MDSGYWIKSIAPIGATRKKNLTPQHIILRAAAVEEKKGGFFPRGWAVSSSPQALATALRLWLKMAYGHWLGWTGSSDYPPCGTSRELWKKAGTLDRASEVLRWSSHALNWIWDEYGEVDPPFCMNQETEGGGVCISWEGHWTKGRFLCIYINSFGDQLVVSMNWDTATEEGSSWLELPWTISDSPDNWESGKLEKENNKVIPCPYCLRVVQTNLDLNRRFNWKKDLKKGWPYKQNVPIFQCQCGTKYMV